MTSTNTTERDFQNQILEHLSNTGYTHRKTKNYDKTVCLDIEMVLRFVKTTQPKLWKRYEEVYGDNVESKFLYRLTNELNKKGTIEVIKNWFKDVWCYFKLFFSKPNNTLNSDLFELYENNIFSVVDELEYQQTSNGNRVDLVVFVNWLPIITIELKDTFSQWVENAMKQYREDRNPNETLFKRSIVHFAMSDEKIYMSTKLNGEKTRFLPFNKGFENPNIEWDFKTSYLYKDILQKNKLSKLITNFIFFEKDEKKGGWVNIFPRFHQLDCVNTILNEVEVGKSYLIQHSAGSWKTKTIAWLSHWLVNLFDKNNERIFDMIIVISDRKVIDKQLQNQVKAIEKVKWMVEKIDKNSQQLKDSMKNWSNIIVTTIQKFPFIVKELEWMDDRKYWVIIDEAHSSQTGETSKKMKQALSVNSLEECERIDDEEMNEVDKQLFDDIQKSKNLKNVSFFAFTATPKTKTLELFWCDDENWKPKPYHLYSMKQAIQEGFIIDVLENYITYDTYFSLYKKNEDDPEYESKKGKKLLKDYVEKHPNTIDKKTNIMLEHFMNFTIHKINWTAKAMVITKSRLHTVLYKKAFDKIIKERWYKIKTLVAFSWIVKHDENEYSENDLNKLPPKEEIRDAFTKDEYKILIVANKFQTGFDQPLIHTMYVDKKLNWVTAVQTLSRANRTCVGKNDTLVMDFANKVEIIQKSFQTFYEETFLEGRTDQHKLYELQDELLWYMVFDEGEVNNFVETKIKGKQQQNLHYIINHIVDTYKKKDKEVQVDFKKTLKRYLSIYSFLSQLIPFTDISLEKLFIFGKYLLLKLPTINEPLPFSILENADVDSYKLVNKWEQKIELISDGELKPLSSGWWWYIERVDEKLSTIIQKLNDSFSTDFWDDDKVFVGRMMDILKDNDELKKKFQNNSKDAVKSVFPEYFDDVMVDILTKNTNFYKKIVDNDVLKEKLKVMLFDLVYEESKQKD